jgi:lysophospholipase L1-like esterase
MSGLSLSLGLGLTAQRPVGFSPLSLPTLYVAGASLESRNHGGDASSRFGHSCVGPLTWANMLDAERLFDLRVAKLAGVSPYWQPGTNFAGSGASYGAAGSFGSSIADQAAEVAAAITPGSAVYCSLGRNDLPTVTAAEYLDNFDTFIATIRAAAPSLIIVPGLWKRDTSAGGTWASGGTSRQDVDDINAGMVTRCAAYSNMVYVELQSVMCDASGDQNPKAGYLVDSTHFAPLGAYVAGKAIKAATAGYITPTAFPARSGDDLLTDLSGTGGTLTNGATGSVADGWTLLRGASGDAMAVAAARFTEGGKEWQRITCTRAATHSGGSDSFTFRPTSALSIASDANYVARARIRVPITTVVQMFHYGLTELTSGATQRSGAIFGTTDGQDAVIADGAAILGYASSEALDLFVETPVMVTDSGSTRTGDVRFSNAINQGTAGTTAVYEITDLQMEPV